MYYYTFRICSFHINECKLTSTIIILLYYYKIQFVLKEKSRWNNMRSDNQGFRDNLISHSMTNDNKSCKSLLYVNSHMIRVLFFLYL